MTTLTTATGGVNAIYLLVLRLLLFSVICSIPGLSGSATTISVNYGSNITVCGIVADQPNQRIQCWQNGEVFDVFSEISFQSITGGRDLFCGIRSRGSSPICWNPNFTPKRLYFNETVLLRDLAIVDSQTCAITSPTGWNVDCWRDHGELSTRNAQPRSIPAGLGINCVVPVNNGNGIICSGNNAKQASSIQAEFTNFRMLNIAVGSNHACGVNSTGFLICRGNNDYGKIDVPNHSPFEFSTLALGLDHTCALRRSNSCVICWGGRGGIVNDYAIGISFESIVPGLDFTCGLTTKNLSVLCWGEGWAYGSSELGFQFPILPGPCVSVCDCAIHTQSDTLCSGYGLICKPCDIANLDNLSPPPPLLPPPPPPPSLLPLPPPPQLPRSHSRPLSKRLLAFAIVGSTGVFVCICTVIYGLCTGVCCGKKKMQNSVQLTITGTDQNGSGASLKHGDRDEKFTFADLALATNNFSYENKIGAGSFGTVYKGKLIDGREVAIKRCENRGWEFQEKKDAFDTELSFLSRLHHKHLVQLVGYCEESEEKLLVYEYMKNGALYDHLYSQKNTDESRNLLNSWKMRIKIALDTARGIEYLHNNAVLPTVHRDIKSSNILLDTNWVARVSDFGISMTRSESDSEQRPTNTAGTVGYIDPEYYESGIVTVKNDVYSFGVVMLELLTGKKAVFKRSDDYNSDPVSLVQDVVPAIISSERVKILDKRIRPPEVNEAEAVELVAKTAVDCVNAEGRMRPTMTDIVANLERAASLCDDSHGSTSNDHISTISD